VGLESASAAPALGGENTHIIRLMPGAKGSFS